MPTPTRLVVLQRSRQPLDLICSRLRSWGCEVRGCASSAEAWLALAEARTDIVLVDIEAEGAMGLVAQVKAEAETRHLPTVVATMDDPATVAAHALALGADDIFALPIEDTELYARIRALSRLALLEIELGRRETVLAQFGVRAWQESRSLLAIDRIGILLIGPAGGDQVQVMTALGGAATAAYAETAEIALERLRRGDLDVAVITAGRDHQEMEQLCAVIRSDPQLFDLPVLLIGRPESFADRTTPFHWGVSDVLFQPFHPEILRLRVNGWVRQQRLRRRLRGDLDQGAAPTIDRLTRLYGHGFLHVYVDHLIHQSERASTPLAIASFGVVRMDRVNQTHGYAAGDRVLAQLGALIGRTGRAEDLPARFAGDRFCIVLDGVSGREARLVGDRIATIVTQTPLRIGAQTVAVDLRTGVAELTHGDHAGALIARAFDRMQPFGIRRAS